MTRDLSRRAAAAQAAADADKTPRCHWCAATRVELVRVAVIAPYTTRVRNSNADPIRHECADANACHERVREVVSPDRIGLPTPRMSAGLDGRETGRTAPHAPESSTTNPEGT